MTWKHIFTPTLDRVVERAFREKGSTYSQIQQLEQEVQAIPPPPAITWPTEDAQKALLLSGPHNQSSAMIRYIANGSVESGAFIE